MPKNKSVVEYTKVSWYRCLNRCHNPNDPDYGRYGKKGIKVCDRWRPDRGGSFANFLKDVGLRPDGMTLDRFPDDKGNYEPNNVRWATSEQQNRHSQNNITYKGRTQPLGKWAEELGIKQTTLTMRLKRMSVADAFETPVMK